jgi:hypothetical protein
MDMVRKEAKILVQDHLGHEAELSAANIGRS